MDIFNGMSDVFASTFGTSMSFETISGATVAGQFIYMPSAERVDVGDYGAQVIVHEKQLHVKESDVTAAGLEIDDVSGAIISIGGQDYALSEPELRGSMIVCKLYIS